MAVSGEGIHLTDEFNEALSALRGGENVLITGNAGTGKSTLLRLYLDERGTDDVIVTAPTGVAALNVGGFTIHRAFGFRPGYLPDDLKPGGKWRPSASVNKVLSAINVLVVDEISMVRADLFDMMDIALRSIRRSEEPFGGVQLILVGDLLQLAPVVTDGERELFSTVWESPYYFSAKASERLRLTEINLTTVWRQSDETFIEILNEVREGSVGEGAREILNSYVDPDFVPPQDWVTLASRNRRVDAINKQRLEALPAEKFVSVAVYTGDADAKSFNGSEELTYARGARVMTLINDYAGRFVNGSFGEIVEASADEIVVSLDNGEQVALGKHTWEIGRPQVADGKVSSAMVGTVTQFPVNLAWAITIHKSQGQTIPKLFIDLSGGTSQDGQFYVAVSRAVSLENLRLSAPIEARHIRASNQLVRRLRRSSSATVETKRFLAMSVDGVDFSVSQHVALVHAVVVDGGEIVANFGSWINPAADLGDFGVAHSIPAGGLALAPALGDFWPLLLRQAEGAVVIGHNLAMLERAVRHQEKGMALNLGVGYDTAELNFSPDGSTPAQQATSIAEALLSNRLSISRGQVVPPADREREGAVFLPTWAPRTNMMLDARKATESDIAWAALFGGSLVPTDRNEVQECIELMGAWGTSRGMWTTEMRDELLERAKVVLPGGYDAPPVVVKSDQSYALLYEGARVAFTGRKNLLGAPADDERLAEICASRGLVYKKSVSKTRTDVLVAGDPASMSRKAQNAREFGTPIITQEEFERWYADSDRAAGPAPAAGDSAVVPETVIEAESPAPADDAVRKSVSADLIRDAADVLNPGTRVAFRGSTYVFGQLIPQGEELQKFCSEIGLEFKQAITKTRSDVLVTDDPEAEDGKGLLARRYGKPMVTSKNFTAWAEAQVEARTSQHVSPDPEPQPQAAQVVEEASQLPSEERVPEPAVTEDQTRRDYDFHAEPYAVTGTAAPEGTPLLAGTVPNNGAPAKQQQRRSKAAQWALRFVAIVGILTVLFVLAAISNAPVALLAIVMLLWMAVALAAAITGIVAAAKAVSSRGKDAPPHRQR
ncbi:AAA family ATPase [Corynebacterium sanguinis]|uniref:AAA family ATPase n=1 Tax=Corynebacterium sanguinis TaxID=2594913 RepID=A0A6C1TZ73_9CORY|nr:AAA family ATPase [Corynebacterium sanguinis]TVS29260.1 AAA family ATPase [Corynebacterium sanguinis]